MPVNTGQVVEDAFHRLQTPIENDTTTDENLTDVAQLVIWSYDPSLRGRVHAGIKAKRATLHGTVDTAEQRAGIERAVAAVKGMTGVSNQIEVRPIGRTEFEAGLRHVRGEPMLFVTRYCGLDAASVTSAIHNGLNTIDAHLAGLGILRPEEAIVIYRNRLKETVTLEIGYPVTAEVAQSASGEIKSGRTPEGQMLLAIPGDGVHALVETHDRLLRAACGADLVPSDILWQRFPLHSALHAADRAELPLFLPVAIEE